MSFFNYTAWRYPSIAEFIFNELSSGLRKPPRVGSDEFLNDLLLKPLSLRSLHRKLDFARVLPLAVDGVIDGGDVGASHRLVLDRLV